jgi:hypothetical protein
MKVRNKCNFRVAYAYCFEKQFPRDKYESLNCASRNFGAWDIAPNSEGIASDFGINGRVNVLALACAQEKRGARFPVIERYVPGKGLEGRCSGY